jgi:hypothetical protein
MVGIGAWIGVDAPGAPSARDAHVVTARIVFDTMYYVNLHCGYV